MSKRTTTIINRLEQISVYNSGTNSIVEVGEETVTVKMAFGNTNEAWFKRVMSKIGPSRFTNEINTWPTPSYFVAVIR